jgi:hypothetical protein
MTTSGIENATFWLLAQSEPKYLGGGMGVGELIQVPFFHHKSDTDLGSNKDLRSKRPASDRLSHSAVFFVVKLHIVSKHRLVALYIVHVYPFCSKC